MVGHRVYNGLVELHRLMHISPVGLLAIAVPE
jgi:hypothetical protein